MPLTPAELMAVLPPARAGIWQIVDHGCSGDTVLRHSSGAEFAKCTDAYGAQALRRERDALEWLTATPIAGPRLLDWREQDCGSCLVMTAVDGVPACDIPASIVTWATRSMAALMSDLHAIPVGSCPLVRRIPDTVAAAKEAVARSDVAVTDFDYQRLGRTAEDLLGELVDGSARARLLEADDLVVCHGDPCLPNLMIDPETGGCTGVIDVGRLGVADRYLDLALVARSMAAEEMSPQYDASDARAFLGAYGVAEPDEWRLEYYRLLDEFS